MMELTEHRKHFKSQSDTERDFTAAEIPVSFHFGTILDDGLRCRVASVQVSLIEDPAREVHAGSRCTVDHFTQTSLSDAGVALVSR
jgi:hypothetical protein